MDNPQYHLRWDIMQDVLSFKPYYKWITLNTEGKLYLSSHFKCFKPYYKWITLNTKRNTGKEHLYMMCFKPYYKWITLNTLKH